MVLHHTIPLISVVTAHSSPLFPHIDLCCYYAFISVVTTHWSLLLLTLIPVATPLAFTVFNHTLFSCQFLFRLAFDLHAVDRSFNLQLVGEAFDQRQDTKFQELCDCHQTCSDTQTQSPSYICCKYKQLFGSGTGAALHKLIDLYTVPNSVNVYSKVPFLIAPLLHTSLPLKTLLIWCLSHIAWKCYAFTNFCLWNGSKR